MAKVKGRLVYETPTWEELQEQKDAGILAAPTPTPVPTWEELQIQKDQGIFSEPTPAPTAGIGGAFSEPADISQLPQLAAVPESEIPFNLNMIPLPFVPIVPINLSNVVTAGTGLAKFTALRELESYIISKVTGKEYKFGVTKGVSEFLPEDTSQGVKDVVDILEMFGQGALIAKTDPKLMKLWKAATEKITTDANIPKKVYISNEAIRSIYQTGENITPEQMQVYKDLGLSGKQISSLLKSKADIEVDVIANMDKPWFAKMKTLFGIKPKSQIIVKPEGIAVKQTGVEALPWETTQAPLIKGKAAGAQETAVETPVETAEQPQEGLIKAYHGTKYDFENFDVLHRGKLTKAESAKNAFFFTDKKDIAEGYATLGESEKVEALLTKAEELEKIAQKSGKNDDWKNYEEAYREYENASLTESEAGGVKGQTKEVYLDMKNPYIKDKQGHAYEEKELATWVKEAKEKGHDGIIIKNAADSVNTPIESGKRPESEISTIYGVFEPNQIKQSFIPPPVQETPVEEVPAQQPTEEYKQRGVQKGVRAKIIAENIDVEFGDVPVYKVAKDKPQLDTVMKLIENPDNWDYLVKAAVGEATLPTMPNGEPVLPGIVFRAVEHYAILNSDEATLSKLSNKYKEGTDATEHAQIVSSYRNMIEGSPVRYKNVVDAEYEKSWIDKHAKEKLAAQDDLKKAKAKQETMIQEEMKKNQVYFKKTSNINDWDSFVDSIVC